MQRDAARHMTHSLISTNPQGIERLRKGLAGFCCDERNCAECLRMVRDQTAPRTSAEACVLRGPEAMLGVRELRKPRRPSLKRQIAAAEKATGKSVTSITLTDGTKLDFGQGESIEPNPWLVDPKVTKQ